MTDMPETRALARTTTAFTIVEGGVKDNVLPKTAKAVVNHRLHPNDDANSVLEWDRRVVKDVEGVKGVNSICRREGIISFLSVKMLE